MPWKSSTVCDYTSETVSGSLSCSICEYQQSDPLSCCAEVTGDWCTNGEMKWDDRPWQWHTGWRYLNHGNELIAHQYQKFGLNVMLHTNEMGEPVHKFNRMDDCKTILIFLYTPLLYETGDIKPEAKHRAQRYEWRGLCSRMLVEKIWKEKFYITCCMKDSVKQRTLL